jgi:pimeloyl-ACP methyl ester carboxylesterase
MNAELAPFTATPYGVVVHGMRGGTGPPALLLHGTAGSWRNFRPWLPALLPRLHLVLPDLPGFGSSPPPRLRPRLRTWARLLHALVAELAAPPQVLVGLGLGASVALAYLEVASPAAASPTATAGPVSPRLALTHLILHTPAYYPGAVRPAFRWGVRLLGAWPLFPLVRLVLDRPRCREWFVRHLIEGPDVPAEDARLLREDFRRASLPVLRGLARDLVRADFRPLLRRCAVPTLALVSENDPFVYPAAVEQLATLMPRATVVVQRGLAHGWTAAAIAEQRRLLARFLDEGRV